MNKTEIAAKLVDSHNSFIDFVRGLNETDFGYSFNEKWTAGQQLDHIVRGAGPVRTAFVLPKLVPALLFGKSKRSSLGYDEIVERYRGKLAAGGKASGRFVPQPVEISDREKLAAKLETIVRELAAKVDRFTEDELDRYRLPHPILGKLTLREMLYFTIYHVEHHHTAARGNLEQQ